MYEVAKKVRDLIKSVYAQNEDIRNQIKDTRDNWRLSDMAKNEKVTELQNQLNSIESQARQQLAQIKAAALEEIHEKYMLNPADLNGDMQLLQSGIRLTREEVQALYDRNDTPTMKTAIARYAEDHQIPINGRQIREKEAREVLEVLTGGYFNSAMQRPEYRDQWLDDKYLEEISRVE